MTSDGATERSAPGSSDRQWLFTLLPAFPLVLLVLRLWYLGKQDAQTMIMLVQYVNPVGLLSSLLATTVWVLPVLVLAGRTLGAFLRANAPAADEPRWSAAVWAVLRIPSWVVTLSVLVAALVWPLRYLPSLVMMVLIILVLPGRGPDRPERRPPWRRLVRVVLPIAVGVAMLAVLGPAAVQGWTDASQPVDGRLTAVLLLGPPLATPLLTGPMPAAFAHAVLRHATTIVLFLLPVAVGAVFIDTPVLPSVAVEVGGREPVVRVDEVVRGYVVTVDDLALTMLDEDGKIRFIGNDEVVSRTLCSDSSRTPSSVVAMHGWSVERTAIEWLAPAREVDAIDLRCLGRPVSGTRS